MEGRKNRFQIEEVNIRELAADYLHLAQDADGKVDRLRRHRHAELLKLADDMDTMAALRKVLKKMPVSHRFSNPAAFATAWDKWHEEFKTKGA